MRADSAGESSDDDGGLFFSGWTIVLAMVRSIVEGKG